MAICNDYLKQYSQIKCGNGLLHKGENMAHLGDGQLVQNKQ